MSRNLSGAKSEAAIVSGLRKVFERLGFQVQQEFDLGAGLRADLVVSKPAGPTYLFEIKAGSREQLLPFATIAQVSAYKRALRAKKAGSDIHAVISSNVLVSPAVEQVSEESEILLVELGQDGAEFLSNFRSLLEKLRMRVPPEIEQANPQDFRDLPLAS